MLATRTTVGESGKVFSGLPALSTPNNLAILRKLVLSRSPKRTLEIGLSFGGSCLVLASCGNHTAIDPFQSSVWDNAGVCAARRAGFEIDFRADPSYLALPRLLQEGKEFDLIYVDGSHLFEDVFVDAYLGSMLLAEGGIIAFDDSTDPNVAKVLSFLSANSLLRHFDLSALHPNPFRYRMAHLLGRAQMTAFQRAGAVTRPWNARFRDF